MLAEFLAKVFKEPTITNPTSPGNVWYCYISKEGNLIECGDKTK